MNHKLASVLEGVAGSASLVKYGCPCCHEAIYTTPPLNVIVICTLCEEILVAIDVP